MELENSYLIAGIISLLVTGLFFYLIITAAISNSLEKHNKAQLKMLAAIAEQQGADKAIIDEIILESESK
jgi:hypothetical protein